MDRALYFSTILWRFNRILPAEADERERVELALQAGIDQIKTQQYRAELEAAGASPIHQYAVAFDGKTVVVEKVE